MSKLIAAVVISLCSGWSLAAQITPLTIERLYSDPDISGPAPRALKFSPTGERVTFLKGKLQDFEQLDLWEYHITEGKTRLLVDSKALLAGSEEQLSDEEKARRERQRISAKGIIEYYWSDDGSALLFPLAGDIYYAKLGAASPEIKRLTHSKAFETDIRFSPQGTYVSFIREQNLYVIHLNTGQEIQLTQDGEGLIKNAMAEFIAQEELGRYTGYWWAKDESKIAFTRVDESPIGIEQRYEIDAASFKVFDQRYPKAGTANAILKVGVVQVETRAIQWLDIGDNDDIYIARVNWLPDSNNVMIQRLSRNQKTLDLLVSNSSNGQSKVILTETSDTWINLHDDLNFLKKTKGFIFASERSGYKQLYLHDLNGRLIRPITQGAWVVNSILAIDEQNDIVYFDGFKESAVEKHLYSQRLTTDRPEQVTRISQQRGWHEISMPQKANFYLDSYSNSNTPPAVSLHSMDGSRIVYLEENKLDQSHPYFPYLSTHSKPVFGQLKAGDGQWMDYSLIKPYPFDAAKKYPAIVVVYGGPHGHRVRDAWAGGRGQWHQVLANQGYVVFALDNRGSYNRGKKFEDPIYKQLGKIEVMDQKQGIDYLKTLSYVDGSRIGMFGWSYGGYMTIMSLLKLSDDIQAGVAVAPVTEWQLYDTAYTERYLDTPQNNPQGYRDSNVFDYVDQLQGSLLIIHGMADDNVLFTNSTKLFKALQDQAKPFEMMTYPGSKHGINGKKTRTHLFNTSLEFFHRHLKKNTIPDLHITQRKP